MIAFLTILLFIALFAVLWLALDLREARLQNKAHEQCRAIEANIRNDLRDQRNTAWAANTEIESELEKIIVAIWGEDPPARNADDVVEVIRQFRARL